MSEKLSKQIDLHEPIAIVGVGSILPGSSNIDELWATIRDAKCFVEDITELCPDTQVIYDPDPGAWNKTACKLGAKVKGFSFPYRRFPRLPPAVVEAFAEWGQVALVAAQDAVDDARLSEDGVDRDATFVVIANNGFDARSHDDFTDGILYEKLHHLTSTPTFQALSPEEQAGVRAALETGYFKLDTLPSVDRLVHSVTSAVAARIAKSNRFGGGHTSVDAACASSFAAMDLGVRRLRSRSANVSVVGGVGRLSPFMYIYCSKAHTMSRTGSFPFDVRASGFVPGEGAGFVVLKRLSDALRSGSRVHAVIRGVGAGSDGSATGPWAPNKEGQKLAVRRALAQTSYDLSRLQYIECHGTGTQVGDAEELTGIEELLEEQGASRPRRIAVGSAKASVGHLLTGAGMAGLLRTIAAIQHRQLPPTANVREPNAKLRRPDCPVFVPEGPLPWEPERPDLPRRAMVNCFGFGGANYNLQLEEYLESYHARYADGGGDFHRQLRAIEPSVTPGDEAWNVPIAIVGVGVDLPGSRTPEALHENTLAGRSFIQDISDERFGATFAKSPPHPRWTSSPVVAGVVPLPDFKEKVRWKIPPVVLDHLDPNQFRLFRVVAEALEQSGLRGRKDVLRDTSMICGVMCESDFMLREETSVRAHWLVHFLRTELTALPEALRAKLADEYLESVKVELSTFNADNSTSGVDSMLGSRIAKFYDLMGGTMSLDSACATGAVAIDQAVNALRARELSAAVVCSSNMALSGAVLGMYSRLGLLSPDGRARPFDANANGSVLGEGAAAFVLRRLPDALRDGQRVLGLIHGVGLASDGATPKMVAPTAETLRAAMTRAYRTLEGLRLPVEYVECQGLGIPDSDAMELDACATVMSHVAQDGLPLAVGSSKGAIGQLRATSGFAALAKVVGSLRHGVVYPTVGFHTPNAALRELPRLRVDTSAGPYRTPSPFAAVNVFGVGGVCGHVVVSAYEPSTSLTSPTLRGSALEDLPERTAPEGSASRAAMARVDVDGETIAGVVHDGEDDLRAKTALLRRTLAGGLNAGSRALFRKRGIYVAQRRLVDTGKTAFVFSGQSSAYPGMYARLSKTNAIFRRRLEQADALAERSGHRTFSEIIYRDGGAEAFESLLYSNFLSCIFQIATAEHLVETTGLAPDLLVGHSLGEFAAAVVSGSIDAETGFEALYQRFLCLDAHTRRVGSGRMAALRADVATAEALIAGLDGVYLANLNAPEQTVIAGTIPSLERALERAHARGIDARKLSASHAYHTPIVAPVVAPLHEALRRLPFGALRVPVTSCARSAVVDDPDLLRTSLAEGLGRQVHFHEVLAAAVDFGVRHFIDMGPHWQASRMVEANLERRGGAAWAVYATNHAKEDDVAALEACERELALALPGRLRTTSPSAAARAFEPAPEQAGGVDGVAITAPRIEGDADARGRALADQYAGRLPDYAWLDGRLPDDFGAKATLAIENLRRNTPPEYLDELRALAEHLGVDVSRIEAMNGLMSVMTMEYGLCSGFAAGIHAANYDLPYMRAEDSPKLLRTVLHYRQAGKRDFLGVFKAGSLFPLCGMNSAGLCASFAAASSPRTLGDGLHLGTLMRMLLERCSSLDDVHALVAQHRFESSWTLLVSSHGEDAARRWEISPAGACVVHERPSLYTNHFQNLIDARPASEDSRARLDRLRQLVTTTLSSVEAAQAVLGDRVDLVKGRETPFSTKNTVNRYNTGVSVVFDPSRRAMHVSCQEIPSGRGPFRVYGLPPTVETPAQSSHETRRWISTVGPEVDPTRLPDGVLPTPLLLLLPDGAEPSPARVEALARAAGGREACLVRTVAQLETSLDATGRIGTLIDLSSLHASDDDVHGYSLDGFLRKARALRSLVARAGVPDLLVSGGPTDDNALAGDAAAPSLDAVAARAFYASLAQEADEDPAPGSRAPRARVPEARAISFQRSVGVDAALDWLARLLPKAGVPPRVLVAGAKAYAVVLATAPPRGLPTPAFAPARGDTFLITGGANGITAEIGVSLAERYGGHFIVVGRSDLAGTVASLDKKAFLAAAAQASPGLRPAEYLRQWDAHQRALSTRANLARYERAGARVTYLSIDLERPGAGEALRGHLARLPAVDHVIHGAGVQRSKRFVDKAPAEFESLVRSKIVSTQALLAALAPSGPRSAAPAGGTRQGSLKSLTLFSSVAGVNGNKGQTDYAATNAVVGALPLALGRALPDTAVRAVAWPAWGEVGMAMDEAVRGEMQARGMEFLKPAAGIDFLLSELRHGERISQTVCTSSRADFVTAHPAYWPEALVREAERAEGDGAEPLAYVDQRLVFGPSRASVLVRFSGQEPFLRDHVVRGRMTVPAVVVTELVLQALTVFEPDARKLRIDDICFRSACVVDADARPIGTTFRIEIERRGTAVTFRVTSPVRRRDGSVLAFEGLRAEGSATMLAAPAAPPPGGDFVDPLLRTHLQGRPAAPFRTAEAFFELHRSLFPEHIGPSYQTLEHIAARSPDAVLSLAVAMPSTPERGFGAGRHLTSPGVTDLMNHTMCEYHAPIPGGGSFIPFRFRGVVVLRPFVEGARYWVSTSGITSAGDEVRFRARILGEDLAPTFAVDEVVHRRYES